MRAPRRASPSRRAAQCIAVVACLACQQPAAPAPAHDGPLVLITVEGLRADVVGATGAAGPLAPNLQRLADGADWAGTALAASSRAGTAIASLWTGLKPWQHQVLVPRQAKLGAELVLLPEALADLGFRGVGFQDGDETAPENGYGRGLESLRPVGRGAAAAAALRLIEGRRFVWIHLVGPTAPYRRRDALLHRLPEPPPELPPTATLRDLEPFFDPAVPLPLGERRKLWALYRLEVAWVDGEVGRLLEALAAGGRRDRTLVAVAGVYGQEMGEHGQVGAGGNLGRRQLEVPLILDLPDGFPRRLAAGAAERVAARRLWATLVEAAGGSAPPGVAPSLFRPAPPGILSALYRAGVYNELSLVEGSWQLRRWSRFAVGERAYYRARLGLPPRPGGGGRPGALFAHLGRAYWRTPPLAGDGSPPRLQLERWSGEGTEQVHDPARTAAMAARLEASWRRFVGPERTPQREWGRRRR